MYCAIEFSVSVSSKKPARRLYKLTLALNSIWCSNFKSLNVSPSHSKHLKFSLSQFKKSKCLGLAEKKLVSQSRIYHIEINFFSEISNSISQSRDKKMSFILRR